MERPKYFHTVQSHVEGGPQPIHRPSLPNLSTFACTWYRDPLIESISVLAAATAPHEVLRWLCAIKTGITQTATQFLNNPLKITDFRFCSVRIEIVEILPDRAIMTDSSFQQRGGWFAYALAEKYSLPIEPPQHKWLTDPVIGIARAIEEDHTDAHPILADALEEAGCADALWLDHLRQCPDHSGGCWVTQMILQQWQALRSTT